MVVRHATENVFWYHGKKINTAFGRLRQRRLAVGRQSTAKTLEQEQAEVARDLKAASGDISALLKLIVKSSQMTPEDFIQKTVGSLLYVYYIYLDTFKMIPVDIDDLIDGLLYIEARNYTQEQHIREVKENK